MSYINWRLQKGDDWLKRNERAYNQLTIPYDIMRWDDWCNSPKYINSHLRVQNEYDSNELYQQAIHANIDDFFNTVFKSV